ncbi:tetratricopeptide repeat protein [Raineya sp.]
MKIICFFGLYLLAVCNLSAQDWQTQFKQGVSAYQAKNYKEAISQFFYAKQGAIDYVGKNNINYYYIVTLLGRAYEDNLQYKEAEKEFREAYEIAKTIFPQNQEGFLEMAAHNLGKNYYLQENYAEAEKYTQEAYQLNKSAPEIDLSIYNTLGAICKEQGKFEEAEKYFREIMKRTNPEKPLFYPALNGLASVLYKQGKLKEAEETFLQLIKETRNKFGEDARYANYLYNIGTFYRNTYQFTKAENYLKTSLSLQEKLLGKKHPDYALTCSQLGYVYQDLGKWQDAEKLLQEATNIFNERNDKLNYILSLNSLGSLKEHQAFFVEAEKLYKEAQQLCEQHFGKEKSTYATILGNLAGLYFKQGAYKQAEPLLANVLSIKEKVFGKNSPEYHISLMNYAVLKKELGATETAEKDLMKCADYFQKNVGKNTPYYISVLQNLAVIYTEKESFLQAEEKYLEAQTICQKVFGERSSNYIELLNNFAQFYITLGNLEKALDLYQQILSLSEQIWDRNHIRYANAISYVGYIFAMTGNYEEAEKLGLKSWEIAQKYYGENQPELLSILNNLAYTLSEAKKYKEASFYLEKAKSVAEKLYGKENIFTGVVFNNVGTNFIRAGEYKKAQPILLESLQIQEKIYGKEHQTYLTAEQNLAWLHSLQNNFSEAEKIYQRNLSKQIERIFQIFPILSENEKISFVRNQQRFFENYIDFCIRYPSYKPNIYADLLDFRLLTKGMIAEASQNLQKKVIALKNPQITQLYNQWLAKKNEYLKLLNAPVSQKSDTQIKQVTEELNFLEKELSKKVDLGKTPKKYSWKDIQKQLKNDEIAIEVIRTLTQNPTNRQKTDTAYVFLIITTQTKEAPELLLAPNASLLETEQLALYGNVIETRKTQFYQELYDNFWGNIIKKSKVLQSTNFKKIYFSPDGVYHKINLATLYDETKKQFLGEFLQIYQLTNLKKLIETDNLSVSNKNAFLVGYPDYQGTDEKQEKPENRGYSTKITNKEKQKLSRFLDFESVSYLPGTKKETDKIADILQKKGLQVNLLQSKQATEEAIKKVSNPQILHIATHGFFLEDVDTGSELDVKQSLVNKNPLLRSGLLLANCSKSLRQGELNSEKEDGILTAYEVAQLELQNTALVVLSACETGLGAILNGEGVFGLQRSFFQAGAKNLIISLWKVDDEATQKFMEMLYENWQNKGMSLQESFYEAQKAIRQQYIHPKYWGAFVLVK